MYIVKIRRKKTLSKTVSSSIALLILGSSAILAMAIIPLIESLFSISTGDFALKNIVTTYAAQDYEKIEIDIPKLLLGFDYNDSKSVISSQLPQFSTTQVGSRVITASVNTPKLTPSGTPDSEPIPESMSPLLTLDLRPNNPSGYLTAGNNVYVKNSTKFAVDAEKLLNEPLNFNMKGTGPKVLILHTHTSEAYLVGDSSENFYNPATEKGRTEDQDYNVVRVGAEMAKVLNQAGIETLHDKTSNDYPSYNGSYKKSLQTVEWYLNKYPSIKVVLDIHRDSMQRTDGTRLRGVTTIDDKTAAQSMIVVGSNGSGLEHPNWHENLKFAIKLQNAINAEYPRLMRSIDLRDERFNMHTTTGSLLLEVGSTGNSLEEAILSGRATAHGLANLLKGLK